MLGLKPRDITSIHKHLITIPGIEKAYVFGSRALGNYKPGSDIDIAIVGEHITRQDILYLVDVLNEVEPLPYFIDIVHFNSLQNHQLKEHILKKGVLLMDNDKPKD